MSALSNSILFRARGPPHLDQYQKIPFPRVQPVCDAFISTLDLMYFMTRKISQQFPFRHFHRPVAYSAYPKCHWTLVMQSPSLKSAQILKWPVSYLFEQKRSCKAELSFVVRFGDPSVAHSRTKQIQYPPSIHTAIPTKTQVSAATLPCLNCAIKMMVRQNQRRS
jgi:hypothetical protein